MGAYRIFFKNSVWNDFKSIPDKDLTPILSCIESLGDNPRQPGSRKLSAQEKYRLRYGRYRIIYSILENDPENKLTVWIVKVGHRKDVYR
jgi:mRNA interferase RelE/StbE